MTTRKPLSLPLGHRTGTYGRFLPGSRGFLTSSSDESVQVWDVPPPWEGDPERLRLEAEVVTGTELDESAAVRTLTPEEWAARRDRLEQRGGSPVLK